MKHPSNGVLIRTPGKLKPNEITPKKQPANRSLLGFQAFSSTVMLLLSFEILPEIVSCLQNRSCFDKSSIYKCCTVIQDQLFKFQVSRVNRVPWSTAERHNRLVHRIFDHTNSMLTSLHRLIFR